MHYLSSGIKVNFLLSTINRLLSFNRHIYILNLIQIITNGATVLASRKFLRGRSAGKNEDIHSVCSNQISHNYLGSI